MSYVTKSRRWTVSIGAFALALVACGSSDVPIGQQDPLSGSDAGTAGSTSSTTGGGSPTGSGGASSSSGGGAGSSSSGGSAGTTGTGGSNATGGGGGAGGGIAVDAGSCGANFTNALVKDCTTEADCTLARHSDCCGNIMVGIRNGTNATFTTAEQTFNACVPGCNVRGCFHADMAETGPMAPGAGQAIVVQCVNKRCMGVVGPAPSTCTTNADCGAGRLCVGFATNIGPMTTIRRECRDNPCGAAALACNCAATLCTGAGFPICNVSAGQVSCDDGRQ